jgi:hypothetical protein
MDELHRSKVALTESAKSLSTNVAVETEPTEGWMRMAITLLKAFPDFDKSTKESITALAVKLSSYDTKTLLHIRSPIDGILSKQKYAPTPFDIENFVKGNELVSKTAYKVIPPLETPIGYDENVARRVKFIKKLGLDRETRSRVEPPKSTGQLISSDGETIDWRNPTPRQTADSLERCWAAAQTGFHK